MVGFDVDMLMKYSRCSNPLQDAFEGGKWGTVMLASLRSQVRSGRMEFVRNLPLILQQDALQLASGPFQARIVALLTFGSAGREAYRKCGWISASSGLLAELRCS